MTVIAEVLSEARSALTVETFLTLAALGALFAAGAVWVVFMTGGVM